jgi:hypothetical protein
MVAPATPNHEDVLKRAADLRARGLTWAHVAERLHMTYEDLDELIFQNDALYFELQRAASVRHAMDRGVYASNHECNQLKDPNPRISQRAADILGRFQGECAWIDLQFRKQEDAKREREVRKLEAEARIAKAEAQRGLRFKHRKCVDEWPNDHREWFPHSAEGWLALAIYEYVLFATPAELAADREDDFREQCANRQIALPDSGPMPYWMRPEYVNASRRILGWAPGEPARFAHDILAINKLPAEANRTDVLRKLNQPLKAGLLEELQEKARREQDLASRERERPEEDEDDNDTTTGPPIPRDPKPPSSPGGASIPSPTEAGEAAKRLSALSPLPEAVNGASPPGFVLTSPLEGEVGGASPPGGGGRPQPA